MLHIVLWKWAQPGYRMQYTAEHVNVMASMLKRHVPADCAYRIICITDERYGLAEDLKVYDLWSDHDDVANASGRHLPSCYRRLKLFDPATQATLDIKPGDRVMSIDIDAVVVGSLKNVVHRKEKFIGWHVMGTYHPRVFNGSVWMFTAGELTKLWTEFNPTTSPRLALKSGYMGSDQGWLSYNLAKGTEAYGLRWPEVASYPRELRRVRTLHHSTRIVFFHGAKKPWDPAVQRESAWIKMHWR